MTGGLGFVKQGTTSYKNNEKLRSSRGSGFERQSKNEFIKTGEDKFDFKPSDPEQLKKIREKTIAENRKSLMKQLLLLTTILIILLILFLVLP